MARADEPQRPLELRVLTGSEPVLPPAGGQAHPRRIRGAGRRARGRGRLATGAARPQPDRRTATLPHPGAGGRGARGRRGATGGRRRSRRGSRRWPRAGDDDTVVVAYPFRHRGTAESFGPRRRRGVRARSPRTASIRSSRSARSRAALAGHDPGETVRPLRPRDSGGRGDRDERQDHHHPADRAPGEDRRPDAGLVVDRRHRHRRSRSSRPATGPGPGGAARVLADPAVQVAVTETARGGILLRGVGTAVNDVSVVTNISADHLGLLGVHTRRAARRGEVGDRPDHQADTAGRC